MFHLKTLKYPLQVNKALHSKPIFHFLVMSETKPRALQKFNKLFTIELCPLREATHKHSLELFQVKASE